MTMDRETAEELIDSALAARDLENVQLMWIEQETRIPDVAHGFAFAYKTLSGCTEYGFVRPDHDVTFAD